MLNKIALSLPFLLGMVAAAHASSGQGSAAAEATSSLSKDASNAKDECRISGMVVTLAGAPIRGAFVQLENADDRGRAIKVLSDSDGRFEMKGIAPARYYLRVARNGFVCRSMASVSRRIRGRYSP
jgi:protocatechuate 3,4-dioxygenase beta subunit